MDSKQAFKELVMGNWDPDPVINECIAFLKYATPKMVSECKRQGTFTREQIRIARQIAEDINDNDTKVKHGT